MSAAVSPIREPLITGNKTYHDITEDLIGPTEKAPNFAWVVCFLISVALLGFGIFFAMISSLALHSASHKFFCSILRKETN